MIKTSDGYMQGSHREEPAKEKFLKIIKKRSYPYRHGLDEAISKSADLGRRKKIRAEGVKKVEEENNAKQNKALLDNIEKISSRSGGMVD